jgi:hypothetical protein
MEDYCGWAGSFSLLTFDYPIPHMAIGPPSSPEVVVQLIHDLQTDDYVKLSAAIVFILDYGAHIFDRMTLLVFDSLSAQ